MIHADRQSDMFAATGSLPDPPPPSTAHLPDMARQRLDALLATARAASRMPWSEQQAEVTAVVFHQMANWLPPAERDAMRAAFTHELDRLSGAG